MIDIEGLTFFYSDCDRQAIKEIDLRVSDGEFVLITGPSGSGKSSLCRCLNGLIPHFYGGRISGRVTVEDINILKAKTSKAALKVGMVFQDPENQLIMSSVEREIAFGLENIGFSRDVIYSRVEESLETTGIIHLRKRHPTDLSGGEKQKVVIASVLAMHPKVLVLDEPTSQLDSDGSKDVLTLVKTLNKKLGLTVILVEHRMERVIGWADRLLIMDDAEIVYDGDPREVLKEDISSIGICIPPIVDLAMRLKTDKIPLSVKEGKKVMEGAFRKAYQSKIPLKSNITHGKEILTVNNLDFSYDGLPTLRDVNLSISEGEFVAIIGSNGSGKSTLAKHFNGLLKPVNGDVIVSGSNTKDVTVAELARTVGYLCQNPNNHLFADTVEGEIAFTLKSLRLDCSERIDEVLENLGILNYKNEYPRFLSGGEKERIALASVIVSRPKILILDEPTRGLEQGLKRSLCKFMDDYRRDGNAVVLITHDVELVSEYADRVILLCGGEVVMDGPTREVLRSNPSFSPQINRLMREFDMPEIMTIEEVLSIL